MQTIDISTRRTNGSDGQHSAYRCR